MEFNRRFLIRFPFPNSVSPSTAPLPNSTPPSPSPLAPTVSASLCPAPSLATSSGSATVRGAGYSKGRGKTGSTALVVIEGKGVPPHDTTPVSPSPSLLTSSSEEKWSTTLWEMIPVEVEDTYENSFT
ncbi:hypothetical protein LIER_41378 [Lithospermum erythrorhizon]|uniref:Uncharacterized protein n=1 Tax=Lithospermum erythrorhizon TaxID=34254 RepID=A0AAV3R9X6_LITER